MTPKPNAGSSWDRVAAELRACREAQQRAWGDIDNTTLGRFLAGEVTPEEQRQIENALNNLPELRKLTDLVREVLGEPQPAVPSPAPVPYGPTVLPFPQPQPQPRMIASGVPPEREWNTPRPARERKPWVRDPRFHQRVGLAIAACLLLTLGVALPQTKTPAVSEAGPSLAFFRPVADRRMPLGRDGDLRAGAIAGNEVEVWREGGGKDQLGERDENLLARVDASVQALEAEGKQREAEMLARQYINNLTRQALVYQEKGDLDRAEPALDQARRLCIRTLGSEAPEAVRTRNSLAGVYQVALNTAPASPYLDASSQPRFTAKGRKGADDRRRDKPRLMTMPSPASAVVSYTAPAPPVRSESAYAAPRAPHNFAMAPPPPDSGYGQKRSYAGPARPYGHLPPGDRTAAYALCQRITHRSQKEVKTAVVPVLTQALREAKDAAERQRLAHALGRLGPAAGDAVPTLLDTYRRATSSSERAAVLLALGQIGPAAGQAVPVLVDSLRSKDQEVRKCAAHALVLLGPAAHCCRKDLAKQPAGDPLFLEVLQRIDSPEGRSGIDDQAECFSVEAIQLGRDAVFSLAKTAHIEVRIETVPGPAALKEKTKAVLRQAPRDGVYLCIEKEAPDVLVFVSETLQKQGLTDGVLRQVLEPHLRARDFDRGLQAGIRFLNDFEKKQARK